MSLVYGTANALYRYRTRGTSASSGTTGAWSSSDGGATWTQLTTTTFPSNQVTFDGTYFWSFAKTGSTSALQIIRSTDMTSWSNYGNTQLSGISGSNIYVANSDLGLIIAGYTPNGTDAEGNTLFDSFVYTTPDGVTLTSIYSITASRIYVGGVFATYDRELPGLVTAAVYLNDLNLRLTKFVLFNDSAEVDSTVFANTLYLAVTQGQDGRLYALTAEGVGDSLDFARSGIYRSSDFTSWTRIGSVGSLPRSIAVSSSGQIAVNTFINFPESGDPSIYYLTQEKDAETIAVNTADLDFDFNITSAAESSSYLMIKNSEKAYLWDGLTLTAISDADYPGVFDNAVTSITRVGTVATVTTDDPTNIQSGSIVTISGASQAEYNGPHRVTVTGEDTFTFSVSGSPATPATGTIIATGGRTTVPGVAFLDDYFFVMDEKAVIYNCDLNDPASWLGLDFIIARKEPGRGVALARSQNYVIALKEWSTEFFFNAGNATGSPLSPVDSGFTLVGCASGRSVAYLDETLFWVSQTKQKGRSVYMMVGLEQRKISTPDVERILDRDDLDTVYAYGLKISGHALYILTLKTSGVTIVYDSVSQTWEQWTSLIAGTEIEVDSIELVDDVATVVTVDPHGLVDGGVVTLAGAEQEEYNGNFMITYISTTSFSIKVTGSPDTPATGTILATPYTSSYFSYSKYVNANGVNLVLHETDGHVYEISDSAVDDDGTPILVFIRTGKFDGGTTNEKTCGKIEIVGNKVDSLAMIRYSDDDYQSFSRFRTANLNNKHVVIRRCGQFCRRSFDIQHISSNSVELSALELDIGA